MLYVIINEKIDIVAIVHYRRREGSPIVLIHGFGASAFRWSLGRFAALVATTGLPELVSGVALLNFAGQFSDRNVKSK